MAVPCILIPRHRLHIIPRRIRLAMYPTNLIPRQHIRLVRILHHVKGEYVERPERAVLLKLPNLLPHRHRSIALRPSDCEEARRCAVARLKGFESSIVVGCVGVGGGEEGEEGGGGAFQEIHAAEDIRWWEEWSSSDCEQVEGSRRGRRLW